MFLQFEMTCERGSCSHTIFSLLFHELLRPTAPTDFGGVDVPLRIDGQMMQRLELSRPWAGTPKCTGCFKRLPIQNHDLRIAEIRHIQELLLRVRRKSESGRSLAA